MDLDQNPDELLEEHDKSLAVSPFEDSKGGQSSEPHSQAGSKTADKLNKVGGTPGTGGKKPSISSLAKDKAKSSAKEASQARAAAKGSAEERTKQLEQLLEKSKNAYAQAIATASKVLRKVLGINLADTKILMALLFSSLAMMSLPIIFIFLVVMMLWEAPSQVIGMGWDAAKAALGISIDSTINSGAAGKFAYEFEVKNGSSTAVAAPASGAPKEGTLAYKYSLIDWEKSKYQTIPNYTNCQVNTKEVQSAIDGKKRHVIDSVVLRNSSLKSPLKTTAKAICINKIYPIFNTIMRTPLLREGINKELAVRFAYAEPKGAKSLQGKSKEEVNKVLRDKTLKRIWNANLQSTLSVDSANQQASNQAAADQASQANNNQPCDPKTTSITACENQNATQKENDKLEDLIAKRNEYKKPCGIGTSITACASDAEAKKNNLLNANTEIINILENRYRDKATTDKKNEFNSYTFQIVQNNQICGKNIVTGYCPVRALYDAADKYAEVLIGYYNSDKAASAANQNQAAAPPPPAVPSASWPTSCQENYQPTTGDDVDKAIALAVNDLLCGKNPKSIYLKGITLPPEERGADPNTVNRDVSIASIQLLCRFTSKLLTDEEYKKALRYRIASAANASWQSVTYAHTNRKRFLDIKELGGDFYKVSSLQKAQEYNYPVNNTLSGDPLEQIAIGDAIGTQRTIDKSETGLDKGVGDRLYKQFSISDNRFKGICEKMTASGFVFNQELVDYLNNIFGINLAGATDVARIYKTDYQDLKKAIAALPYYAKEETNVEVTARNMTLGDVLIHLVKVKSNVSDTGTEDGPQNFNRMSLGMKAYMNAASLAMGGQFLRAEQSIALERQVETARRYEEKTRGIAYRLFDTENPRSLLSRLSASAIAEPKAAFQNVASTMLSLFNPIDALVSGRKSLVYYLTGENSTALAASDYDRNNLRLDPAGMPDEILSIDPLQNAEEIEGMQARNENTEKFAAWDGCFKKFIATEQLHLQEDNPTCAILFTSHKELQGDLTLGAIKQLASNKDKYPYLQAVIDQNASARDNAVVWPYSLALKYRAYHYHNTQADALLYLSDPDKEDETLNAGSSGQGSASGTTLAGVQCPANMEAGPYGYVKMPEAPNGEYVIYSSQSRRYGSKQLVCVLYSVGLAYYSATNGQSKLHIGDLNAAGHKSHKWGVAVDIDGRGAIWAADHQNDGGKYSTDATIALGKLFIDTGVIRNIWWCEPGDGSTAAIKNYANSVGKPLEGQMKCIEGHHNHFHVDIKQEFRGPVHMP